MSYEKSTPLQITIKSVIGVVAFLGAIWTLETHYATAGDLDKLQRSFSTQFIQQRSIQLEDEVFKLDVKKQSGKKLDPVEAAMYERYMRQLEDTRRQQRDVEKVSK